MKERRTVLVTGASSGIGLATAEELVKRGYRVFAGARKTEDLERLKTEVGAEPVELDVSCSEHIEALQQFLSEKLDGEGLDALVNNAGMVRYGPWECLPMKWLREQFETNVFGLVAVTQVALPWIRKAKGRVVNVSSISGRISGAFLGPYSASKFALEAISDSLRRELSPLGVKVVSINPGPIKTPIWGKKPDDAGIDEELFGRSPQGKVYRNGLVNFRKYASEAEAKAEPVSLVVKAMVHALEARSPRTRYFVGKGMSFHAKLANLLPDRWLDMLMEKSV